MKDKDFLTWIKNRLIHVYNESPDTDFVLKLQSIIDKIPEDEIISENNEWTEQEALLYILNHSGLKIKNGVIKSEQYYKPTSKDMSAIDYLCEKWDYTYVELWG